MDAGELWWMMEMLHPGINTGSVEVVCGGCGSEYEYEFCEEEEYQCPDCGNWNEPDRW